MSRASRQTVFLLSITESLALTLQTALSGQPKKKGKMEAVNSILGTLEALHAVAPMKLDPRQGEKVIKSLESFQALQNSNEDYHKPEVLIACCLVLTDFLFHTLRDRRKVELVSLLSRQVQNLYDAFDRQGNKLPLLEVGAELGEMLIKMEV